MKKFDLEYTLAQREALKARVPFTEESELMHSPHFVKLNVPLGGSYVTAVEVSRDQAQHIVATLAQWLADNPDSYDTREV